MVTLIIIMAISTHIFGNKNSAEWPKKAFGLLSKDGIWQYVSSPVNHIFIVEFNLQDDFLLLFYHKLGKSSFQ
jgi:hypothetical protein